jgi:endoglucanase
MGVQLALLAAMAALVTSPNGQTQAPNGVPAPLLAKLTRGVNVTRWFCYGDAHDTATFAGYLTDEDFANFKRLGVHFVRLCISPEVIYKDGMPDPVNLPYLDKAIARLEAAGLAVLVDLHDNGQMKLDAPDHDNSGFVRFWEAMARHYKGQELTSTVFELLNEPVFYNNGDAWYKLQRQTVQAIRAIDPDRTIVVASTRWDGIDTLLEMKTLEAKNLIYSFHCYDPFLFTHQGATWTGDQQKAMRSIPFPSTPEAVSAMIDKIPEQYRSAVVDYGKHRYDSEYLRSRLDLGIVWGAQNRVPVLLGEFGSFPPVAPPDSRGRWFDGMRAAIDDLALPNAIWGYDDGLGLGRTKSADGAIHLDPVTLEHFFKAK